MECEQFTVGYFPADFFDLVQLPSLTSSYDGKLFHAAWMRIS